MTKRQAVIVLEFNNIKPELRKYGVRYRERGFWPWSWTKWLKAREFNHHDHSWDYNYARFLADQALANGVVEHPSYEKSCQVIVELDEE
jgi:hypothetical protein